MTRRTLTLPEAKPIEVAADGAQIVTCTTGAAVVIGRGIKIQICAVHDGDNVRFGIEAPKDIPVHRGEIYRLIQDSERLATGFAAPPLPDQVLLQDRFLAALCHERVPVTISLTNGRSVEGVLRTFDTFAVLVGTHLLYKHLIATIQPTREIRLPRPASPVPK